MTRSTTFKLMGGIIAMVGLWAALVPYVGPTFGYTMPPGADVPAWEWTASHTQRHLLPGLAAILAGALLFHRSRSVALGAAGLALAAGVWMIISPFVPRAWLDGGMGGMGGGEPSVFMQIITPLGYHYLPGIITAGLAAFALGLLLAPRARIPGLPETAPAYEDEERFERPLPRERQPVG